MSPRDIERHDGFGSVGGGLLSADIDPRLSPAEFWVQSPNQYVPYIRAHPELGPMWNPRPIKISVGRDPSTPLAKMVHEKLMSRLLDPAFGNRYVGGIPQRGTPVEDLPDMVIIYGNGQHDQKIRINEIATKYPKPRPIYFVVQVHDKNSKAWIAPNKNGGRAVLSGLLGNNGLAIYPDDTGNDVQGMLVVNMQGNTAFLTGNEEKMWHYVVRNTLSHYAMRPVTTRVNIPQDEFGFSWEDWNTSSREVAEKIALAAHYMGTVNYRDTGEPLIQDKADIKGASDFVQEKSILIFMEKTDSGIGESMRCGIDEKTGLLVTTISGGGKVEVSSDPTRRQFAPIGFIVRNGTAMVEPRGSPYKIGEWKNSSVETRLAALLARAGAEFQSGRSPFKTFEQFMNWTEDILSRDGKIAVLPKGMKPKWTYLDHIHHKIVRYNPNRVVLVKPSITRFPPEQDGACGFDSTMLAVLEAVFQTEYFTEPGPDDDPLSNIIIAIDEFGHGTTFLAKEREALTHALYDEDVMLLGQPWTGHVHLS